MSSSLETPFSVLIITVPNNGHVLLLISSDSPPTPLLYKSAYSRPSPPNSFLSRNTHQLLYCVFLSRNTHQLLSRVLLLAAGHPTTSTRTQPLARLVDDLLTRHAPLRFEQSIDSDTKWVSSAASDHLPIIADLEIKE